MKRKARIKKIGRFKSFDYTNILFLTLISVISILPIIYIINNAFKPLSELFMFPPKFFVSNPTLQNIYDLIFAVKLSIVPFSRYLYNSVIITALSVILTVAFSATCAYAFSKMRFPGKDILFKIVIVSLMFAPEAVSITRYLIISRIGIMNTYAGHILPQLAMPVSVFLLKQFMDQLPKELNEAAKIDGASEWVTFTKIIVPNVMPAIATVLILSFQTVWGDASTSTLYMIDESMKTLPYFVGTLTSGLTGAVARQGAAAAAGLLMFLPNFLIFAFMQKMMIQTMVNSGIK